jgi:hypothetical protein
MRGKSANVRGSLVSSPAAAASNKGIPGCIDTQPSLRLHGLDTPGYDILKKGQLGGALVSIGQRWSVLITKQNPHSSGGPDDLDAAVKEKTKPVVTAEGRF